jgi:hypothetical protein
MPAGVWTVQLYSAFPDDYGFSFDLTVV